MISVQWLISAFEKLWGIVLFGIEGQGLAPRAVLEQVSKRERISELSSLHRAVTFTLHQRGVTVREHMAIVRSFDRRQEPRWPANLQVLAWGVDTQGERFMQEAYARDISMSGALLTGLDADLRSGDVIGILYGKKKARYRVVWIRYDGGGEKMQLAVHRLQADECPWGELLREPVSKEQARQSLEGLGD